MQIHWGPRLCRGNFLWVTRDTQNDCLSGFVQNNIDLWRGDVMDESGGLPGECRGLEGEGVRVLDIHGWRLPGQIEIWLDQGGRMRCAVGDELPELEDVAVLPAEVVDFVQAAGERELLGLLLELVGKWDLMHGGQNQ
ncbi:hypothetical protein [Poriferisphaera sp. WC338]|uniref:hypothetical protein n=1 Tax=Poriferisphaera sp. WC338 TaxID=3425129 RepID=UPI003D818787